ncbi:hypothetical protein BGZ46_010545 [Entomortierella lignicola]|nr:hypothetical protein BGZ46_010545 [Entomortierella lignicola]
MSIYSGRTDNMESTFSGMKSSNLPSVESTDPPLVLITGAGIAGLMLAIMLERANIPYLIFEKVKEIKPLVCGRPMLYNLLLSRIPSSKIHLGKRVVSFLQNKEGVMVRFQDRTTVHGDILVGADGAYSGVRQHLYKELDKVGKLPKSDSKPFTVGYVCMVGLTDPMDSDKFPEDGSICHADTMINNSKNYSWNTMSLPGNSFSWSAVLQLDSSSFAYEHLKNSEWSLEENEKMIKEIRDFKTLYGPLGDLISATPRHSISRVFLEDKFFETWTYSRTALLGDVCTNPFLTSYDIVAVGSLACHKLLPSSGLGAVNAIQDAVVLANCIYEMRVTSYDSIVEALKSYHEQRSDVARTLYNSSKFTGKIHYGHTFLERAVRHVFNYLPTSAQNHGLVKTMAFRPQISFLPLVPNRGKGAVIPQKPSQKYLDEQAKAKKAAKETKKATGSNNAIVI